MFIGAIQWFDNSKGFGLLCLPEKQTLFLHIRGFVKRPLVIQAGDVVVGAMRKDNNKDRMVAYDCRILEDIHDWKYVVGLLGKADLVYLNQSQSKTTTPKTAASGEHLMGLAAYQMMRNKKEEELYTMITSAFRSDWSAAYFMDYADLIAKALRKSGKHEQVEVLLKNIYRYFGERVSSHLLFAVWKAQKFYLIGYDEAEDYEIPEEILNSYATEIGLAELKRIRYYECGPSFCASFVPALLENMDSLSRTEMEELSPFLEFLSNEDKATWQPHLARKLNFG